MCVRVLSASLSPKTFDSHFLDMMYVDFMKNFFLESARNSLESAKKIVHGRDVHHV